MSAPKVNMLGCAPLLHSSLFLLCLRCPVPLLFCSLEQEQVTIMNAECALNDLALFKAISYEPVAQEDI